MYGASSVVLIVFMVGRVACSIYLCNCVRVATALVVVYVPSIISCTHSIIVFMEE